MSPRVTLSICPNQVVGVKDSRMGEEICACIRLQAGQECTEEEIKAFCKGKVGSQSSVSFQTSTPSGCWGFMDESPWIKSTGEPNPDSARLFLSGCVALFFSSQISHFKIPHYVVFVNQYPLTVSGKVRGGCSRAGTLAFCPSSSLSLSPSSMPSVPDSEIQVEGADGETPAALRLERQSKNQDKSAPFQSALTLLFTCALG